MPTTSSVHFGGFEAEARWRPPDLATLLEVKDIGAQRIVKAMEDLHWGYAQSGDVLLREAPLDPDLADLLTALGVSLTIRVLPPGEEAPTSDLRGGRPCPYAVVPGVPELVSRLGLAPILPTPEVAQRVNSKVFSNDLVLALALPGGGQVVSSAAALARETAALLPGGPFLVKDPYGVSGRGALIISDRDVLTRVLRHLERQEEEGRRVSLLVQPVLDRVVDFSCHFEIGAAGTAPLGVQRMINDGHAFQVVSQPDAALLERLDRARIWRTMDDIAAALQQAGYTGPVCVDALVLRDDQVVPLLEINARRSMGLLHLTLRRNLSLRGPSELSVWTLSLRQELGLGQVIQGLQREGIWFDGQRGLLPLSAGALLANRQDLESRGAARARLYALGAWDDAVPRRRLLDGARTALAALGVDVLRCPR